MFRSLRRYVDADVRRDPFGLYSFIPLLCMTPLVLVGVVSFVLGIEGAALILLLTVAGFLTLAAVAYWLFRGVSHQVAQLPADLLSREYRQDGGDHG